MNPVGSSYTFTLSFRSITASINKYDVSRKHCFLQRTDTRITCIKAPAYGGFKPDAPTIRKHAGSVIFNTLVVGMSPVNCLIEHMFTNLLFMRAEREEDWYLPLCAVENMLLYFFAPCHFATVVRPTNHQSRVSATFLNSTLQSCPAITLSPGGIF